MIVISNRLVVLRVLNMTRGGFTARDIAATADAHGFAVNLNTIYSAMRDMEDKFLVMRIGEATNQDTGRVAIMYCLTNSGRAWVKACLKRVAQFDAWESTESASRSMKHHTTQSASTRH